ncbi:Protein of unknown function [Paenibacillus sp. UNC496MF]|uniref:DUF2627 domain-containing protein n=1 Tax=Paenibacillus sp. UNC496MF TaxID=1502753 RepID=UPI0008EF42B9|nr:DUF2627 domain-containing protein [Paenibacillus sp. UNC496MF]SFI57483.1 Protein of unknown function [Paenibacillus sp. UNC496MF]
MKQVLIRFIAVLLLVIPGLGATYGFLLMKDAIFHFFASFGDDASVAHPFEWWRFIAGLALFLLGVGFIGGWTFFRDRKRNYVATRFRKRRPRPPRPQA